MDAQPRLDAPSFRDLLVAHGLLVPLGADGLYARSGTFETVLERIEALITRAGAADRAETLRFPPGMARAQFERSGYLNGFPHLVGTVHCFCGDDRAHRQLLACTEAGEDWTGSQVASDIVLTPAACYPLYPALALRGPLAEGGHIADLQSWCFRREPSLEPTRLQMFRQREWVRLGDAEQVLAAREEWMRRAQAMIGSLGLPYEIEVANDPFFGRVGKLLANSQREQQWKFELLVPVNDGLGPTACVSFNYHGSKFGDAFDLRTHAGEPAHTGCVGFGLERLTVALFRHHGFAPDAWPEATRQALQWT